MLVAAGISPEEPTDGTALMLTGVCQGEVVCDATP
jgi:hypothetical protein